MIVEAGLALPDAHVRLVQPHRHLPQGRKFFMSNLMVRIHFIIVMIGWTGLAPWEFEFLFAGKAPGSLTSACLEISVPLRCMWHRKPGINSHTDTCLDKLVPCEYPRPHARSMCAACFCSNIMLSRVPNIGVRHRVTFPYAPQMHVA